MVIFLFFFFGGGGGGGGGFWHFSATYNAVLLNDLHKHAPSVNSIFLTFFFMKFSFLALKKEEKKKKKNLRSR